MFEIECINRMELSAQLLSLQTALRNLEKSTTAFVKIKYKGGNETYIKQIVDVIRSHLTENQQITYKKNLLLLLIINTNFENNSLTNIKEYQHLVNLIPTLSVCLLSNIMVQLEFLEAYSNVITTISLQENKVILYELEQCLKYSEMTKTLSGTSIVLNAVINLFSTCNQKNNILEQIADIFNEMLGNLSKFNPDKVENWTFVRLQEHIGYTLLELLKSIRNCSLSLERLINSLIDSTIIIMKVVTLNVFCIWAEVEYEDGIPLQLIIAEEAYSCIRHLQKFPPAATLVEMLNTIAKKPQTLAEKILKADVETIINNVNKNKENQMDWFRALMNTNIFDNKKAIKCLNKWHRLCKLDDVCRIFYLSSTVNDKSTALKCASILNLEDLKSAVAKYFYKSSNCWNMNISEELTVLFNKMGDSKCIDEEIAKQIYLLLIQNRKVFLQTLFANCLNAASNTKIYRGILTEIKDIVAIDNVAEDVFLEVFSDNDIRNENLMSYKELINTLIGMRYFSETIFICKIFHPRLKQLFENGYHASLQCALKLLNVIDINCKLVIETLPFIIFLFEIAEKYRKSLEFCKHYLIVHECVVLILAFEKNGPYSFAKNALNELCLLPINKFYATKLYEKVDSKILNYTFKYWNIIEKAECMAILIKILPISVKSEWILIIDQVEFESNYETALSLINNVLFLLGQIMSNTQQHADQQESLLQFCLEQYLIVVKEFLQPKHCNLQEERVLCRCTSALLKLLPANIRQSELTRLMGLLSNEALKSLKGDRDFVLSLIAIQDANVSQMLAQRMLS